MRARGARVAHIATPTPSNFARQVARAAGVDIELEAAHVLPWHPGRCAAVKVAGTDVVLGHAGELHPQVLEAR